MASTQKPVILVVDDEEPVRHIATAVLGNAGYEVLVAADGIEALELVQQRDGDLDVLLTDIVMPRMGGFSLAQHIEQICPNCRILLMTGYCHVLEQPTSHKHPVLEKPFRVQTLLHFVENARKMARGAA
jgi:two-component system cell cycle sensor histidine kinase/response regulator CckA